MTSADRMSITATVITIRMITPVATICSESVYAQTVWSLIAKLIFYLVGSFPQERKLVFV
jgi:hypothetical protein